MFISNSPKQKNKKLQKSLTVHATSIGFTTKRNIHKSYRINRVVVCRCSHKPLFEISYIDNMRFNEPIQFAIQDYFLEKISVLNFCYFTRWSILSQRNSSTKQIDLQNWDRISKYVNCLLRLFTKWGIK